MVKYASTIRSLRVEAPSMKDGVLIPVKIPERTLHEGEERRNARGLRRFVAIERVDIEARLAAPIRKQPDELLRCDQAGIEAGQKMTPADDAAPTSKASRSDVTIAGLILIVLVLAPLVKIHLT